MQVLWQLYIYSVALKYIFQKKTHFCSYEWILKNICFNFLMHWIPSVWNFAAVARLRIALRRQTQNWDAVTFSLLYRFEYSTQVSACFLFTKSHGRDLTQKAIHYSWITGIIWPSPAQTCLQGFWVNPWHFNPDTDAKHKRTHSSSETRPVLLSCMNSAHHVSAWLSIFSSMFHDPNVIAVSCIDVTRKQEILEERSSWNSNEIVIMTHSADLNLGSWLPFMHTKIWMNKIDTLSTNKCCYASCD